MQCCFQGGLLSFHLMVSALRCRPRREGIPTYAGVVMLVETQVVRMAEMQAVKKAETCLYY